MFNVCIVCRCACIKGYATLHILSFSLSTNESSLAASFVEVVDRLFVGTAAFEAVEAVLFGILILNGAETYFVAKLYNL